MWKPILFGLTMLHVGVAVWYVQRHPPYHLFTEPIRVSWKAVEDPKNELYDITLHHWTQQATVQVLLGLRSTKKPGRGAVSERLRKNQVALKRGYVFVREGNWGGSRWRDQVDHVYTLHQSYLVHIGTLSANGAPRPGDQFDGIHFRDVYDGLETCTVKGSAQSTGFYLMLRDHAGTFEADLEATWEASLEPYEMHIQNLKQFARWRLNGKSVNVPEEKAMASALYCLALSRYCAKEAHYRRNLARSRKAFHYKPMLSISVEASALEVEAGYVPLEERGTPPCVVHRK